MPIKSPFDTPRLQFEIQKLAFVALGSNLDDSRGNVLAAMGELQKESSLPLLRSSLWQSTPVDCPPGSPMFVNAVAGLLPQPTTTPEIFLERLMTLEAEFGHRLRTVRNEPRRLDLDLISFRQETRSSERLILPHPRAHLRRFVLQPLNEIASGLVLPGQVLTVGQLLETLSSPERLVRLT